MFIVTTAGRPQALISEWPCLTHSAGQMTTMLVAARVPKQNGPRSIAMNRGPKGVALSVNAVRASLSFPSAVWEQTPRPGLILPLPS